MNNSGRLTALILAKVYLKKCVFDLVNAYYKKIQNHLIVDLEVDCLKEELSQWDLLIILPDTAIEKKQLYRV